MPLTIAHPVAVLPLRRCGLSMSALVVGSLIPDLEYFLHVTMVSEFSHTPTGLFAFCLPAGLIVLWLFHHLWKPPMIAVLGDEHSHHFKPYRFRPFSHFLLICSSLLIGAFTHLLWDAFTHDYGWAVQRFSLLSQSSGSRPRYRVLHLWSTVLGGAALMIYALYHRKWTLHALANGWRLVFLVGWISVAMGIALGLLVTGDITTAEGLRRWGSNAMVVGSMVMLSVVTLLCMIWHIRQRRVRPTPL